MYVEGLVIPVPSDRKDDYIAMAARMSAIMKENGALSITECWGEDVPVGERTSFTRAVDLQEGETVVLAWITYPDRATRDACNKASFSDPRMEAEMADMPFDGKRMIVGGFETIYQA